ncbi:ACP S-malonyltransferase [Tuwongella immobilis]|uniref:Malonyl CoA-acyl carrier protein transacylase n=1 Tax=Tuwongella immobilis TaxID=692036 RepID=A0A6C2YSF6_9BACT|nr:ACP S-malonyltransferase [Tuwongella immobilis]VIP04301.1 malonyl -acyl carrier protein transacylase : Malonyl CoA-acyl carrier protein transacylase OS=uncultured Acidobacteria bacterium A2 PE=3 SV=1: Acyl_transf_1 [Tuwongella immobilis]VTS05965.1 malonyl -acyl carrier protein transacylase : Malonyl CoA-acyl carrier protein transacylase OS=uncultured Acidobacteria bacterium A2 PE=3 SV=1: Acyl_transf_1 [Tuwongella immobilis]
MAKVAFVFPGQGAQSIGMGKALIESSPAAAACFEQANDILGYDLRQLCLEGPIERLNSTEISQPAIFVVSMAALAVLRETEPSAFTDRIAVAGLSLGEYTALAAAEAIPFADALRLVALRGKAMQAAADATPSGMLSILMLEEPVIAELVEAAKPKGFIAIANRLCPGNIVVSGQTAAIDEIERLATEKGARTVRLAVAGAFHTPLMKPADEQLAAALASMTIQTPVVPVWSNVDAKPHTDPAEIRQLLVSQVLHPVLWEASMRGLLELGVEKFYELGPGRVLAGLMKRIHRKADFTNIGA